MRNILHYNYYISSYYILQRPTLGYIAMSVKCSGQQKGQQAPFRIVNGRFNILTLLESDQDASGTPSLGGAGLAGG